MNSITEILPGVYVVEVPQDAKEFRVCNGPNYWFSYYHDYQKMGSDLESKAFGPLIPLPPGDYTFLFTTESMSEEQAGSVVEQQRGGGRFKDYTIKGSLAQYGTFILNFASTSFHSALTAKNLDPAKNWAVLQKNK